MKKIIIILFFILFCSPVSNSSAYEDIRQSGMLRLSDIFLLSDSWDVSTIDGITYQASPMGFSSYQHQDWKVFLNGIPIDIDIFGTKSLDRVPVDLSQVGHIKITSGPGIYAGQKITGGIIDISTISLHKGLKTSFRTGFGNETGDPGPYYYTDKTTSNIDKVGNIIAGGTSYRQRSSCFGIFYKREIGYPTDRAVFHRNNAIAGGYYPRQKLESFYFNHYRYLGDYKVKISNTFGISNFEDFLFLRQYGREIPVKSRLTHYGSTGYLKINQERYLRYRFSYSANEPKYRGNSLNLDFDWKQETVCANIEAEINGLRSGTSRYMGSIGLGLNHYAVHSNYVLSKSTITEATIYGSLFYRLTDRLESEVNLFANFQNNNSGLMARFHSSYRLPRDRRITFTVTYDKTLLEESHSIWYWQKQGYSFLENNGVSYNVDGNMKPMKKFTATISYHHKLAKLVWTSMSAYYRSFSNIFCESQYLISNQDYSAPDNLEVQTDCRGKIVGTEIRSGIEPVKKLRVELFARYQDYIDDEQIFAELWQTVPKYKFSGTVTYNPAKTLSILSRLRYQGKTEWVDYESDDIDGIHNYFTVDDFFCVDITAQKYFQKRKIRTSFSIRNLFNNKIKYHPIGAQFDLSYFAQIEFLIN
ncbi:MAG: TonB-dependent receptor [candidate division Zixibacteria bacterium]|nr:TonB-dependent receptor [candidate division Zixibacteria bacterium]